MRNRVRVAIASAVVALVCLLLVFGSSVRAAEKGVDGPVTIRATGRGAPWVNLKDGHDVALDFIGARDFPRALAKGLVEPLSLAAGDFDGDGIPDLICGFTGSAGPTLTLHRGNVEAIYPGTDDAPFLSPARVLDVPAAPHFLAVGDFNADDHVDIVVASRSDAGLHFLAGDGRGRFQEPRSLALPGRVTALIAGDVNRPDGQSDLVVAIEGPAGAQLLVYEWPFGALDAPPEIIGLPGAATALALGQFDQYYYTDLAVAAGPNLVIVAGRDRQLIVTPPHRPPVAPASLRQRAIPFAIQSLAAGDFGDANNELALLADDGSVYVLETGDWNLAFKTQSSIVSRQSSILKANVSVSPKDDLLLLDSSSRQVRILMDEAAQRSYAPDTPPLPAVDLAVDGEPVVALPMRLNKDALSDLVILRKGSTGIAVTQTQPDKIFTVNTSNDGTLCDDPPKDCSFRGAINKAQQTVALDEIRFAVASVALTESDIRTRFPLPEVTRPVTIDGSFGAGRATVDITGGEKVFNGNLLRISAGQTTLRRLNLKGFNLELRTNGENLVEGNIITTGQRLLVFNSPTNMIGGTNDAARNVISANRGSGIVITGGSGNNPQPNSNSNSVVNNHIGVDETGSAAQGNNLWGMEIDPALSNIVIERNVVAANRYSGIHFRREGGGLLPLGKGTRIQGNFIGVGRTGSGTSLGNAGGGIYLSADEATVGGTTQLTGNQISRNTGGSFAAGLVVSGKANRVLGNRIASNDGAGIMVPTPATSGSVIGGSGSAANTITGNQSHGIELRFDIKGNSILGNSISVNGGLGIRFNSAVTPNDAGDADGIQNYPLLALIPQAAAISVTLDSTKNGRFRVEFFSNDECDASGYGEGLKYLGFKEVTTDDSGKVAFTFIPEEGPIVTATATNLDTGSTSEFSACLSLGPSLPKGKVTVLGSDPKLPLHFAEVTATRKDTGQAKTDQTDSKGFYEMSLAPGNYGLKVTPEVSTEFPQPIREPVTVDFTVTDPNAKLPDVEMGVVNRVPDITTIANTLKSFGDINRAYLINPALLTTSGLPDMPYADEMTQVFDYVKTPPAAPSPTAEAPYRLYLALRAAEQMSKNAEAYSEQVTDIFGTIFGLFVDLDDFSEEVNGRALSAAAGQIPSGARDALTDSFKKLRSQLVSSRNKFIGYFRSKFDLTAVQGKRAFNALATLITKFSETSALTPEIGFENPIPQAGDVVKEQLIDQASNELLLSTYAAITETTVAGAIASARTFNPTEDNIRVAHYGVQSTLALATETTQAKASLAYTPVRSLIIDASNALKEAFEVVSAITTAGGLAPIALATEQAAKVLGLVEDGTKISLLLDHLPGMYVELPRRLETATAQAFSLESSAASALSAAGPRLSHVAASPPVLWNIAATSSDLNAQLAQARLLIQGDRYDDLLTHINDKLLASNESLESAVALAESPIQGAAVATIANNPAFAAQYGALADTSVSSSFGRAALYFNLLSLYLDSKAATSLTAASFVARKAKVLAALDAAVAKTTQLDTQLQTTLAAVAAAGTTPATAAVTAVRVSATGQPLVRLDKTPQDFTVTATVSNVSSQAVANLTASIPTLDSKFAVTFKTAQTITIATLAAGASQQLTWNLTFAGSLQLSSLPLEIALAPGAATVYVPGNYQLVIPVRNDKDTDGDGMPDSFETKYGFNINLADAGGDADADGLSNLAEYLIGTDPRKRDSDGDTFADGDEVDRGSSPVDSLLTPQTAVPVRGDPNTDARVDVADVAFLLRYLSGKGPAPNPLFAGDANNDGRIDIVDAVLLLKRVREK